MIRSLFLVLLVSMLGLTSAGAAFTDTRDAAVETLYTLGYVEGYSDGTFRPQAPINRAELIKILMPVAGKAVTAPSTSCFPDVPDRAWYTEYVCTAKAKGWITGYADGTFRPEIQVNRAEAAKIAAHILLDNTLPETISPVEDMDFQDVRSTDWYNPYVKLLTDMVYVDNGGRFDPGVPMTRGDMAQMVYRHVLTSTIAPIAEVQNRWDGDTVTELNSPGEAVQILGQDLALALSKVLLLTPQMLLDAQAEEDARFARMVKDAPQLSEADLLARKYTVAREYNGVLYGVLPLDSEGAQAKPSFVRSFYVTWAFVAFDVETKELLAFALRSEAVDRPSILPTIDLIPEDWTLFVRFHGEGPAPGSFYPDALSPQSIVLRSFRQ